MWVVWCQSVSFDWNDCRVIDLNPSIVICMSRIHLAGCLTEQLEENTGTLACESFTWSIRSCRSLYL